MQLPPTQPSPEASADELLEPSDVLPSTDDEDSTPVSDVDESSPVELPTSPVEPSLVEPSAVELSAVELCPVDDHSVEDESAEEEPPSPLEEESEEEEEEEEEDESTPLSPVERSPVEESIPEELSIVQFCSGSVELHGTAVQFGQSGWDGGQDTLTQTVSFMMLNAETLCVLKEYANPDSCGGEAWSSRRRLSSASTTAFKPLEAYAFSGYAFNQISTPVEWKSRG